MLGQLLDKLTGRGKENGAVAVSASVSAPVPSNPKTRVIKSLGTSAEIEEYVSICKKLEADTPAVRMLQLRQFLAQQGIPEYDLDEVHQHLVRLVEAMDRKRRDQGRIFYYRWHPLRKKDLRVRFKWWWSNINCRRNGRKSLYDKTVPQSVLVTVEKIADRFPDAHFFVSDIVEVDDPFLIVTFEGVWPVIVEFWNEPGFRPTK